MEEAAGVEWGHLRVVGKPPLLTGAAFGATPLLWVACRASPGLVHVFCDTHLLSIWRLPADPVFLLLGSGASVECSGQPVHYAPSLLIITEDGCIWHLKLANTTPSVDRPSKKQKSTNAAEIRRLHEPLEKIHPKIRVTASQPGSSQSLKLSQGKPLANRSGTAYKGALKHGEANTLSIHGDLKDQTGFSSAQWKELAAETYKQEPRAVQVKNIVAAETLLERYPGATVAGFGPKNSVAILTSFGPAKILHLGRNGPSPSAGIQRKMGREPTCLLFASSIMHVHKNGLPGHTILSHNLFDALFDQNHHEAYDATLLLQGDMDGKVYAFHFVKDSLFGDSPKVVCDLQQPVVALFPGGFPSNSSYNPQQAPATQVFDKAVGATCLIVVGRLGRVAFISSVNDEIIKEEPSINPFLALSRLKLPSVSDSRVQPLTDLKQLLIREEIIQGPVLSACLLGLNHLCYTVGTEAFIAKFVEENKTLPKINGAASGIKMLSESNDLRKSSFGKPQLREVLVSRRVSISNVAAIAGPGEFTAYTGGRPLVVFSSTGSLQSVKVSEHFTTPATIDKIGFARSVEDQQASAEERVKTLLESIADVEVRTNTIGSHDKALTLSMNELAVALPKAYDILRSSDRLDLLSSVCNSDTSSKPVRESESSITGLSCKLSATPVKIISIDSNQLCFGGPNNDPFRKHSRHLVSQEYSNYKVRLDVSLINHARSPLSQYWSLVIELQSCLSIIIPTTHYSIIINDNLGLPVGAHWNHNFNVKLPGGPWGPVIATVFLSHIHDYHKLLLVDSSGIYSRRGRRDFEIASSAACVVLLRQRIDILSLLSAPPPRLGHTSWTPSASGSHKKTATSVSDPADLGEGHILGSFSGSLAWSYDNEVDSTVRKSSVATLNWQDARLGDVVQRGVLSKAGNRLKLASQQGGTVEISSDVKTGSRISGTSSAIQLQASSLLLGVLTREAMLWRLNLNVNTEDIRASSNRLVETMDPRKEKTSENLDIYESLVQQARTLTHRWKKYQRPDASTTSDLVVPLLSHTYTLTREILQAYKSCREGSLSTSPRH